MEIIISLVIGFIGGIAFTLFSMASRIVRSDEEIQDDFRRLVEKINKGV